MPKKEVLAVLHIVLAYDTVMFIDTFLLNNLEKIQSCY